MSSKELHFDRTACPYSCETRKVINIWLIILVVFVIAAFGLGAL